MMCDDDSGGSEDMTDYTGELEVQLPGSYAVGTSNDVMMIVMIMMIL